MVRVSFQPQNESIEVEAGLTLDHAARLAGVFLDSPCAGRGACGKCRVKAQGQLAEYTAAELKHLGASALEEGWRLACQAVALGDVTVEAPMATLKTALGETRQPGQLSANVRKLYLRLSEPSVEDQRGDSQRLLDELARHGQRVNLSLAARRDLAVHLRESDFAVTAVLIADECVAVEPGDTASLNYGIAFDIGTTSVVGALMDLNHGAELAVASAHNAQAAFGADVISRINLSMTDEDGLQRLHNAAAGTINAIIDELVGKSGVSRQHIYELVAVGNTTMNHLLLGINPSSLALAPFVAVNAMPYAGAAAELELKISPCGTLYTPPNIACFVGSDTVAVALATGICERPEVRLVIDIGTNGELLLGNQERLIACSTAAGPAFEGAEITFGMRATEGAIDRVWIDGDVKFTTIEGAPERGICGSGLIDVVASMLQAGVLDESGRLAAPGEAPAGTPAAIVDRLQVTTHGNSFLLSAPGAPNPVYISQGDVRKLQLAKGAINAGTRIMMKEFGLRGPEELEEVLLAGAFGSYISPESARAIGLVPTLSLEQLRSVGNAASVGARLALLSLDARATAEAIAAAAEHLELSSRADFQQEFMEAMYFPHLAVQAED